MIHLYACVMKLGQEVRVKGGEGGLTEEPEDKVGSVITSQKRDSFTAIICGSDFFYRGKVQNRCKKGHLAKKYQT